MGLHDVARRGVQDKKIGRRSGTPGGRRHAATSADLLIPVQSEYYIVYGWGGGASPCWGGGVKRDSFSRESKVRKGARDVELGP